MRRGIRSAATVATAALALVAAACTIEDASDKRAADSAAAATANGAVATSASGGSVAAQPAPGSAQTTTPATGATGATVDTTSAAAGTAADSGAPAGAKSTPATGNLSPDSVDVGRTSKAALLPVASTRIEVDLNARTLTVFDGGKSVGSYRVAVGSKEWPTQTGEWSITQVVWNPEWIP